MRIAAGAEDLTFLAVTRNTLCRSRIDKYLVGYYTIQFMEQGAIELAYEDRVQRLEGMWFWPAYPGPRIRFNVAEGHETWFHRHIGFQGPLVQHWIAAGLWPTEAQPAPLGRDWGTFFDIMITQSRRPDRWGRLRAINLLEQLLIELAEDRTPAASAEVPWLEPVLERLAEEGIFAPDYARIAAELEIGVSTLRRRFKEATGMSLHACALQARMAKARTLVGETDVPLKTVAERLGYENVYFFSRQFKQQIGVSPGIYRRSRQG